MTINPVDIARDIINIGTTAGVKKDVIDLQATKIRILTDEIVGLRTKVSQLEIENRQLRGLLDDYQPVSKPGHLCPYCRKNTGDFLGNRESHIVQERLLGLERAYYKCSSPQCAKEFNEEIK